MSLQLHDPAHSNNIYNLQNYIPLVWSVTLWVRDDYSLSYVPKHHTDFINWMNKEMKQCVCLWRGRRQEKVRVCWKKPASEQVSFRVSDHGYFSFRLSPLSQGQHTQSFHYTFFLVYSPDHSDILCVYEAGSNFPVVQPRTKYKHLPSATAAAAPPASSSSIGISAHIKTKVQTH